MNDGSGPANGSYDLTFSLFNTNAAGVAIAGPVTNGAITVSNGLFTTAIDFGPGVFTGGSRWLELAVRTNGGGSFMTSRGAGKSRPRRMPFLRTRRAT